MRVKKNIENFNILIDKFWIMFVDTAKAFENTLANFLRTVY